MTNEKPEKAENIEEMSDTVKELYDLEHSTCSLDKFKGREMFVINPDKKYPFSFGVFKAKLILKHFEALKLFVASEGRSLS